MHFFYRQGPLSADFINARCPDVAEREAYVCGPPPLNRLARSLLQRAGIPRPRIHHESFELL
jgi:ferredoxin-NADP reductase